MREGKTGNLEGQCFDREIFALALPALGALAAEPTYVLPDMRGLAGIVRG